jgi:hypothetical protein
VEETQREVRTWREVKWLAADRSRWRSIVKAPTQGTIGIDDNDNCIQMNHSYTIRNTCAI